MGVIYRKKQIYGNNPLVETIGVGGGYAPIGTIISFMGTTAPQDYLACDGSVYNITDYTQLATFFEDQFGSKNYFGGDGETTFAVPDLRGEFLRGTGTNSHADQGNGGNVGAHQNATFIPYTYSYINLGQTVGGMSTRAKSSASNEYNTPGNSDSYLLGENPAKYIYYQTSTVQTSQTDRAYKFSVRPTNTSVLYCIKAIDGGEVYSTNERVVGTWIDGKPVYQKTIDYGAFPSNGATKNVDIDSNLSIDTVVSLNGIATSGTQSIPLPFAHPASNGVNSIFIRLNDQNTTTPKVQVYHTNNNYNSYIAKIILQYTKTTD